MLWIVNILQLANKHSEINLFNMKSNLQGYLFGEKRTSMLSLVLRCLFDNRNWHEQRYISRKVLMITYSCECTGTQISGQTLNLYDCLGRSQRQPLANILTLTSSLSIRNKVMLVQLQYSNMRNALLSVTVTILAWWLILQKIQSNVNQAMYVANLASVLNPFKDIELDRLPVTSAQTVIDTPSHTPPGFRLIIYLFIYFLYRLSMSCHYFQGIVTVLANTTKSVFFTRVPYCSFDQ